MVESKLRTAHDIFSKIGSSVACGFNMFVQGDNSIRSNKYWDFPDRMHGYGLAEKMAREGKIYFTHNFDCKCGGNAFMYGGFFVCNSCGGKSVNESWWVIQVEKDGNAFCCHGLDFENLQESDNYEFGDTFEKAIENYGEKFKSK